MKNLLILVLSFLSVNSAFSQWSEMWTPASYHLYAVEAVTDNVVFAGGYGGSLVRTEDGGANWEAIPIGSNNWIKEIHFHNESVGWLATTSGNSNPADIYKTVDGGFTWTSVRDVEEYSSMSWPTEQIGYFGTWSGTIVKTTDAGQTWSVINLETSNNVYDVQFIDAQTGFALSADDNLHRTYDGGITWEKIHHSGINYFYFKDANNGFCVTSYGQIGTTTDGGATYSYWQSPFVAFKLHDVYFVTPQVGYVIGGLDCTNGSCITKPAILTTTDGGVTWVNDLNHPLVGLERGFYEIDCTPNGTPFIAGSDALVLKHESMVAGVYELSPVPAPVVSPNPNGGSFTVSLPENVETLTIHSTAGKVVYEEEVNQVEILDITLEEMDAGVYFLSIQLTEGRSSVTKLMID